MPATSDIGCGNWVVTDGKFIHCECGLHTRIVPGGSPGTLAFTTNDLPRELESMLLNKPWMTVDYQRRAGTTATFPAEQLDVVAKLLGAKRLFKAKTA